MRTRPHRTTPAWCTRTANAGQPAPATTQRCSTPDTPYGARLSRMPRRAARTDLRGPRCSNASGLPDRGGRAVRETPAVADTPATEPGSYSDWTAPPAITWPRRVLPPRPPRHHGRRSPPDEPPGPARRDHHRPAGARRRARQAALTLLATLLAANRHGPSLGRIRLRCRRGDRRRLSDLAALIDLIRAVERSGYAADSAVLTATVARSTSCAVVPN